MLHSTLSTWILYAKTCKTTVQLFQQISFASILRRSWTCKTCLFCLKTQGITVRRKPYFWFTATAVFWSRFILKRSTPNLNEEKNKKHFLSALVAFYPFNVRASVYFRLFFKNSGQLIFVQISL